jgi:hypothetical protein
MVCQNCVTERRMTTIFIFVILLISLPASIGQNPEIMLVGATCDLVKVIVA